MPLIWSKKDKSLLNGKFKLFFNKSEFECSHQMICSLPFKFVSNLKFGEDTPLPQEYLKSLHADAAHAKKNHIRSIQLWKHSAFVEDKLPLHLEKNLVYQAEVEDGSVTKKVQ